MLTRESKAGPRRAVLGGVILCAGILVVFAVGAAQDSEPEPRALPTTTEPLGISPQADRILREMGDFLKRAKEFTFRAEVAYDSVQSGGQKLQFGGVSDVSVRRPNRLHVEYRGDERKSRVVYDGKKFFLHDLAANVYSSTDISAPLDEAIDLIFEKYGFSVPVADLVHSDVYGTLTESVRSGHLVGRHEVDGTLCNHLAFTQEGIDWQIWIEDGPRPLPRKLLITYKDEEGSPQYSARFTRWDLKPSFSDSTFRFQPQAGADQIEFLSAQQSQEVHP